MCYIVCWYLMFFYLANAVNPYVTGSSPVARAKNSAATPWFCGVFLFFLHLKSLYIPVSKYS